MRFLYDQSVEHQLSIVPYSNAPISQADLVVPAMSSVNVPDKSVAVSLKAEAPFKRKSS